MLRLLLILSFGLVANSVKIDISKCPINYFGTLYKALAVEIESDKLVVCFDDLISSGKECLRGPTVDPGTNFTHKLDLSPTSQMIADYKDALPKKDTELKCVHTFGLKVQSGNADVTLGHFGKLSAVSLQSDKSSSSKLILESGGDSIKSINVTDPTRKFTDISRCIDAGKSFLPGSLIREPDLKTCEKKTCSDAGFVEITGCNKQQFCDNGRCLFDPFCTVAGPGIIDFFDFHHVIEDLCKYTLLKTDSVIINGAFKQRRRKDIGLLDHLEINFAKKEENIELLLDGRVIVNTTEVKFGTSKVKDLGGGLVITKDKTGIHVNMSVDESALGVFWNGQFAQISYADAFNRGVAKSGLCNNAGSLDLSRLDSSPEGCKKVPKQDPDKTINCTLQEKKCGFIKDKTIFNCSKVDSTPYAELCKSILCKYPQLDGFKCPFHEAFARACVMNSEKLGDWRSDVKCDAQEVFCPKETCVSNEFCGKTDTGKRGCRCRETGKEIIPLGDDVTCDDKTHAVEVTVVGCLLTQKGFNLKSIHLNDDTCLGKLDKETNKLTFNFNASKPCGADIAPDKFNNLVVANTIRNTNKSDKVSFKDQVYVEISCKFAKPEKQVSGFRVLDNSLVLDLNGGQFSYELIMKAFLDDDFTKPVTEDTKISLGQKVFVLINTTGLKDSVVAVFIDSCFATDDDARLDLIKDGCPLDKDIVLEVTGNGLGTSSHFAFKMFQFLGSSDKVNVFCQVKLCKKDCAPKCTSRTRRSTRTTFFNEDPPIMSMVWNK